MRRAPLRFNAADPLRSNLARMDGELVRSCQEVTRFVSFRAGRVVRCRLTATMCAITPCSVSV